MTRGGKAAIGVAAAGGVAALLYALLKRNSGVDVGWQLPDFTLTRDYLSPPPLLTPPPCRCPTGSTPIVSESGGCRCSALNIEVLLLDGEKCRSSSVCASGTCVNGSCVPASEWS